METVLLIGYGNPGRRDDGLGPALAREVAGRALPGVTVREEYQLAVEDAAAVAEHDVVVFADADTAGAAPFSFRPVGPSQPATFSTHSVPPGTVLALARDHFGGAPRAYVLAIRGYEFDEFDEDLSAGARENLRAATEFVARALAAREFPEARP